MLSNGYGITRRIEAVSNINQTLTSLSTANESLAESVDNLSTSINSNAGQFHQFCFTAALPPSFELHP